jgi:hypothetical protein
MEALSTANPSVYSGALVENTGSGESKNASSVAVELWSTSDAKQKATEAITLVIAMRNLGYARHRFQSYGRAME